MTWPFFLCCSSPKFGEKAQCVDPEFPAQPAAVESPARKQRSATAPAEGPASATPEAATQSPPHTSGTASGADVGVPTAATVAMGQLPLPLRNADDVKLKERDADTLSVASTHSVKSTQSLGTSSIASELIRDLIPARQREATRLQQAMKGFVKTMVRGQDMSVLSPDGRNRTCCCSLDRRLKFFVIELKGARRKIGLSEVAEVFQGKEPEDISTPLDELCCTLMLQTDECITFRFTDVPSREHFGTCLQVLVDGQQ